MNKDITQTILLIRESYGLKETGLLTYTYPRLDKSAGTAKVPDDHLMPLGLPNMWTSFKVSNRASVVFIVQQNIRRWWTDKLVSQSLGLTYRESCVSRLASCCQAILARKGTLWTPRDTFTLGTWGIMIKMGSFILWNRYRFFEQKILAIKFHSRFLA